jgi:hypothetical protein
MAQNPTEVLKKVLGSKPLSEIKLDDFATERENMEIVAWVKDQYKRSKMARSKIEREWYRNMAMLDGRQYLIQIPDGKPGAGKFLQPPAPPYRVRAVTNKLRPIFRTELARVTSQKPNASVVPASSDDDDLFAAQAGEQIWESLYQNKKVGQVFARSAFWMLQCGTSFIKCWWDQNKMDPITEMKGDICYADVTPFHLFIPDLREIEIENQPFVINAYTKPVEWVRRFYGKELNAEVVSASEILESAYLNLQGADNTQPDSVLCLEAWIKPGAHKLFPDGGYVCIAGSEILHISREGLPYNHKEYPFVKFEHIPTGKFYAESVLKDLSELQREYNRTRSQIIESKQRMAKPQLLAFKGSVDPAKITTEPGQVILVRPGMPMPTPLPLQPLPNYVLQELDIIKTDMEDISGQHQVSKGSAPPGVTAATAISFLQEKDDSLLSHTYSSIEYGFEKLARQSLSHVVQYWDMARTIKTTGSDGAFDAITLKGADIASGTDIRMEAGSSLPSSKSGRQALIMDLMKFGYVEPNEGLKMMEIGGVQKLYQQLKVDESQAQRENLRMRKLDDEEIMMYEQEAQMNPEIDEMTGAPLAAGPLVPVNTWDNHAVHIEVHNRFRKTQAFETLSDAVKAQFEAHVSMHAQSLIVASQGGGADMGMMPAPEDLNMDIGAQEGEEGGGPANQFGPADQSQPPLPGME